MSKIFCFSSTGNSLYVARRIAEALDAQVHSMSGGDDNAPVLLDDEVVGLVFPCYFFGLPRIVARFVRRLSITNRAAYVFAVMTCGGPPVGALGQLAQLLDDAGVGLAYGKRLMVVTNYLPEYQPQNSVALVKRVDARLDGIIKDIKARKTNRVMPFMSLNKRIYAQYPGTDSDALFQVSDACRGCATCRDICPVGNIVMQDGRPHFNHQCEHCLGCLHNCPYQAIDWNSKTQGKTRYRFSEITLDDLIEYKKA